MNRGIKKKKRLSASFYDVIFNQFAMIASLN